MGNAAGSLPWWTVRRIANGDARRPWYAITDQERDDMLSRIAHYPNEAKADPDLLATLIEAQIANTEALCRLATRIDTMSDNVSADLAAAVDTIKTAVGYAAAAIKAQAAKLASMSSVNPADVENAAASLNSIAAGLESVVAAAGEPVTEPLAPAVPVTEPLAPAVPVTETPAPVVEPVEEPTPVETPTSDAVPSDQPAGAA